MARELRGDLQGEGLRIAIVASRFNEFVTQRLLSGAKEALLHHGVQEEDTVIAWVPGGFELPLAAKTLAETHQYDSIVCLGVVIRGETTHFDMVAGQASTGIGRASLDTGIPIMFGVLTTENADQALSRAGGKVGNLGYKAAVGAIEMAHLLRAIKSAKGSSSATP